MGVELQSKVIEINRWYAKTDFTEYQRGLYYSLMINIFIDNKTNIVLIQYQTVKCKLKE